jgi:hypothetical protein
MERSSECGITPENEDWRSLLTSNDSYLSRPSNLRGDVLGPVLGPRAIRLHPYPGAPLDFGHMHPIARRHARAYSGVDYRSGSWHLPVGLEYSESELELNDPRRPTIPRQGYDSQSNSGPGPPHGSHGKHETTDHGHQLSSPAPNEAVSKSMNQLSELSILPDSGYSSRTSSKTSEFWTQETPLPLPNKCNGSPFGSESTDSGDTEMHGDEESLFDDQDADHFAVCKWDEVTIQRLKQVFKQTLHSLVDLPVPLCGNALWAHGTSSDHVCACSFQSSPTDRASSGKKRKADGTFHEDDHDEGNGDGDGSQEPSNKASKLEDRPLRLACPFFKRHPESFRTCGMSDHENSSRVKQHISRKHRMPIYCPRCSGTFKTEHERDTHVRDADCPVGPKANFICATAEQLRNLSRRNAHQRDRENWNAIYKILFPDDPLPESPYLDPLVSYEVNLVREAFLAAAPVAVRTAIQHVIPEEFSDSLQEELERVLRSTHAEIFDQILRRMREDREAARLNSTTTQSSLQTRVSCTPDSGIGSTAISGSSQDEPEPTLNSQDRPASFSSGSCGPQNDGAAPSLPLLAPGFNSSKYHMGDLSQPPPNGTFDELFEYLDASGHDFLTDQY